MAPAMAKPRAAAIKVKGRVLAAMFSRDSKAAKCLCSAVCRNADLPIFSKRGFHNPFRVQMSVVNLSQLEALADASEIGPENLAAHGLIAGKHRRVKILGEGSLSRALTVKAHGFSASAKEKIEAAGGKAELIAVHA